MKTSRLVVDGRPTFRLRAIFGLVGAFLAVAIIFSAAVQSDGLSPDILGPMLLVLVVVAAVLPIVLLLAEKFVWPFIVANSAEVNDRSDE